MGKVVARTPKVAFLGITNKCRSTEQYLGIISIQI